MAWIESHQSLLTHRKTGRLARALGISKVAAIGHLHCFWWWCMDNAPDGSLARCVSEDIADGACWEGDPDTFVLALISSGFVDEPNADAVECARTVHHWMEYAGRLIERRKSDAERKRMSRSGDGRPTDVRRTSDGQPMDVSRNRTQPYPTDTISLNGEDRSQGNIVPASPVGTADAGADDVSSGFAPLTADALEAPMADAATLHGSVTPPTPTAAAPPSPSPMVTKAEKTVYSRDHPAYVLAGLLCDAIRTVKPDARLPRNLQAWCSPMDLLIRRDGRSFEHLRELIEWLPTSEFWRKVILSAGNFRDKIDRLEMAMAEDAAKRERLTVIARNGTNGRYSPAPEPARPALRVGPDNPFAKRKQAAASGGP